MKESQKELIRELANVVHWSYEVKLNQEFPEAFEAKLEVGKWYVLVSNPKHIFYAKEVNSLYFYYGFNTSGVWRDVDCYSVSELDNVREATKEEVKEALIKEAKMRGFVEGSKFIHNKQQYGKLNAEYDCGELRYEAGLLLCNGWLIFQEGKWADVVKCKELTVAQIEKELGYKVKIVKE